MDTANLDHLTDSVDPRAVIRAFTDALSDMTGIPTGVVLAATARVLERELRRRSDDTGEVWRLGRLLQATRAECERER